MVSPCWRKLNKKLHKVDKFQLCNKMCASYWSCLKRPQIKLSVLVCHFLTWGFALGAEWREVCLQEKEHRPSGRTGVREGKAAAVGQCKNVQRWKKTTFLHKQVFSQNYFTGKNCLNCNKSEFTSKQCKMYFTKNMGTLPDPPFFFENCDRA